MLYKQQYYVYVHVAADIVVWHCVDEPYIATICSKPIGPIISKSGSRVTLLPQRVTVAALVATTVHNLAALYTCGIC